VTKKILSLTASGITAPGWSLCNVECLLLVVNGVLAAMSESKGPEMRVKLVAHLFRQL